MKDDGMNGTIAWYPAGRGTWQGRTWNGDEMFFWKGTFYTKGEAERFATSRKHRSIFVTA